MALKSFRLPNHVSFDEGTLINPISVGVYACQRVQLELEVEYLYVDLVYLVYSISNYI